MKVKNLGVLMGISFWFIFYVRMKEEPPKEGQSTP
jgi:hypothetical protein